MAEHRAEVILVADYAEKRGSEKPFNVISDSRFLRKFAAKITAPAFVLGNVSGGPRAHRPMKRVSSTVLLRTPKGVDVRISQDQRMCANNSSRCTGVNLQILASMSSSSNGFAKNPSAPAAKPFEL